MSTNAILKVAVNNSRLMKNIGSVFSGNHKVIHELLQNGRRAGATKIVVTEVDEQTLIISDNGCGIDNMQNLLTLAESGWDEGMQEAEHAYGMGFFSALFSAKTVVVRSKGKKITVKGDVDLLEQDIVLESDPIANGTVVELHGHKLKHLHDLLSRTCRGFSVDVSFINKEGELADIEMKNRINDNFEAFDAGHILLNIGTTSWVAYLQGFEVASSGYAYGDSSFHRSIIHLDASAIPFLARMPDRDQLINNDAENERINAAVKKLQREKLEAIKAADRRAIFNHQQIIVNQGFLDIYNDIDELPSSFFGVTGEPQKYQSEFQGTESESYYHKSGDWVSKLEIAQGLFLASQFDQDNYEHPYAMALQMAIHEAKIPHRDGALDSKHWFYSLCKELPDMSDSDFDDAFISVSYSVNKSTVWRGVDVYLVDSYIIRIPCFNLEVEVKDSPLAIGEDEGGIAFPKSGFIIPSKNYGADVIKQVYTWWDGNDGADEDARDADIASLDACLALLYGNNSADIVRGLISDMDWSILKALSGKSFSVQIALDENERPVVTVTE